MVAENFHSTQFLECFCSPALAQRSRACKSSSPAMHHDGSIATSTADRFAFYWICFTCSTLCLGSYHAFRFAQSLVYPTGSNLWFYRRDLLYLTFQAFLISEPSSRLEGLAMIDAPVKRARTFGAALSLLQSWRQLFTVVNDLGVTLNPSSS